MVGLPSTNCSHLFVEEWSQGLKLATFSLSLISMKGIKMHVIKMLSTLLRTHFPRKYISERDC